MFSILVTATMSNSVSDAGSGKYGELEGMLNCTGHTITGTAIKQLCRSRFIHLPSDRSARNRTK